jgi:biotin operon repressor
VRKGPANPVPLDIQFDARLNVFMPPKSPPAQAPVGGEPSQELLGFFLALGDRSRLKIVGLLSQQAHTVEQLSDRVGLSESTVSHHLARLSDAGLVSARAKGHYSVYSLEQGTVSDMARRLLTTECLPALARDIDRDAADRKVLASLIGPDGRFTVLPTQEKKLLVLLRHVLRDFEPGVRYNGKKVDAILSRYSDNATRLRRSLVELGFMESDGVGRDFWRKDTVAS